jgi:hypothetical protein
MILTARNNRLAETAVLISKKRSSQWITHNQSTLKFSIIRVIQRQSWLNQNLLKRNLQRLTSLIKLILCLRVLKIWQIKEELKALILPRIGSPLRSKSITKIKPSILD